MPRSQRQKDIISEQEFNKRMRHSSTAPRRDSPADSEQDTSAEYLMGVNFMPSEGSDDDGLDEVGEVIYADDKSTAASEVPSDINLSSDDVEVKLPPTARVISAEKPSPNRDREKSSDTN